MLSEIMDPQYLLLESIIVDVWTALPCNSNKKLSYCWETVRHESMPRIAEMDVEMTT